MKKTSLKTGFRLSTCMVALLMCLFADSAFAEEPELRVTIKGMISNIDEAGPYILSNTHLQLYPCETTGKLSVQMKEKGKLEPVPGQEVQKFYLDGLNRLVPPSILPRTGLPVFGMFNFFKVRGLQPGGCYKICVMMLDNPYTGFVSLTDNEGKPLEIIIPEPGAGENSHKIVIDMMKKPLSIPAP